MKANKIMIGALAGMVFPLMVVSPGGEPSGLVLRGVRYHFPGLS